MTTAQTAAGTTARTITVWQDQVRMRVLSKGSGPAVVFLHGPWGLTWDPFLDELARHFTVHAPEHPGTTPDAPDDIYRLDGLWDLVLCYDELLNALSLDSAALIGHSFGGMMACELAAATPTRIRKLAMIAPIGFWRDHDPVTNWMMLNPGDLPAHVFHDPKSSAAQQMFGQQEPEAKLRMTWAMGSTGKFIWPLPDKGLKKRIHRVTAPSLLIWGANDRLVPPSYAEEFTKRLKTAKLEVVAHAGHAPHQEHPEAVSKLLTTFLK